MAGKNDSRCPSPDQTGIRPQPRSSAQSRKRNDDDAHAASGGRSEGRDEANPGRRLPTAIASKGSVYNDDMPISARNKLRGKIEEIQLGDIMAHVVVRVGDNLIESAITRRSADELKLKKGDTVSAVVKLPK